MTQINIIPMTASTVSTITTTSLTILPQWKSATWEEYLTYLDHPIPERVRLFFNRDQLLIDMGSEGINHSGFSDLFTMLFILWFSQKPEQTAASFGRCLLEKPNTQAAAPRFGIVYWEFHSGKQENLVVLT